MSTRNHDLPPTADGSVPSTAAFVISVAARLVGVHEQTLRYYERAGLVQPARSKGRIRLVLGPRPGARPPDSPPDRGPGGQPGRRRSDHSAHGSYPRARIGSRIASGRGREPAASYGEATMNLNKLTEKAQEAIVAAQRLAESKGNTQLEPEHLLDALVTQEGGIVPAVLEQAGRGTGRDRSRAAVRDLPASRASPAVASRCSSPPASGASSRRPRPRPSASRTTTSRPSTSCSR